MMGRNPIAERLCIALIFCVVLGPTGCGVETGGEELRQADDYLEAYRAVPFPLEAPCTVNVEGFGHVNIEEDYIPNVVACENGNAPPEALKAQAVQARGFLYYKLGTGATVIRNSEADQVYKCTYTTASERHFEAARATRGQVLTWKGTMVAPFYVAGARPPNPDSGDPVTACKGTGGTDSRNTERFVTYNQGLSGCNIKLSPLGWVPMDPPDCNRNPANRGCASQNGQACLARRGWGYEDMIRFYYGADIVMERAGGACGGPYVPPTEHDVFCAGQSANGGHCYDENTRVVCQSDTASSVETCDNGCASGACWAERDEAWFCWQHGGSDGWQCFDEGQRVECIGGAPQSTETCTAGCESGQCLTPADPGGEEPGPGEPSDPGTDPDPDDTVDVPELPGQGGSGGLDPDGSRPPRTELGPLVNVSQGVEGGCSSVAGSGPYDPSALLVVLGFMFASLRRRYA